MTRADPAYKVLKAATVFFVGFFFEGVDKSFVRGEGAALGLGSCVVYCHCSEGKLI